MYPVLYPFGLLPRHRHLKNEAKLLILLVQLGGYCRRSTFSLINLSYLLASDRLLYQGFVFGRSSPAVAQTETP